MADRLGEVSTFDAEDGRLFTTLAGQAATALENGRLIGRLREQVSAREHEARHDGLTGLANRTLFGQRLAEVLGRPDPGSGVLLLLDPEQFVSLAERTGLAGQLCRYVLDRALAVHGNWPVAGPTPALAVNLPARLLLDLEWPRQLTELLHRHGLEPARLLLEIAEPELMSDPDRLAGPLRDLAGAGIGIALDRFGTGRTSVPELQRLPVRELRPDHSFVAAMSTDPAAEAVVRCGLDLSRNLGMAAVAVGVQDDPVLERLLALECPLLPGRRICPPMPAKELAGWLSRRPAVPAPAPAPTATRAAG